MTIRLPSLPASATNPVRRWNSGALPCAVALLLALSTASPVIAQEVISGRVVDASTNQPVAGAQVSIVGADLGGLTQATGRFLLLNVQQANVTLEVVMLGYQTWSEQVQRGTLDLEIRLEPRAIELDALYVTGTAGAQRARSLGNTVGTVEASQVNRISPLSHVESLLTGAVPGVTVGVGGGEVGTGSNIRIRGASSISLSSQPLVYVDGVRVNGNNADVGGGIGGVGVDNTMMYDLFARHGPPEHLRSDNGPRSWCAQRHRAGQSVGERLQRELQRQAEERVPERSFTPARGRRTRRAVAAGVQYRSTPQRLRRSTPRSTPKTSRRSRSSRGLRRLPSMAPRPRTGSSTSSRSEATGATLAFH